MRRYPLESQKKIVMRIIEALPELKESYREHLFDNSELLPYVYLPDAVRDLTRRVACSSVPNDIYDRLADAIENALTFDPDSHDLVALGLLDEIRDSELWDRMRDRLGPKAMKILEEH